MKQRMIEAIDRNRENIIAIAQQILQNPEMGFKEFKTAQLVKDTFAGLGITYEDGLAVTGVKGTVGSKPGFHVCIVGEMDAVKCYDHENADPQTGAAHACGHHAQVAAMLGAAYGIMQSGVLDALEGKISFFAVPAEEFVELDYRQHLADSGKIACLSGKQELIRIGAFDDIDMAMMIHAHADTPEQKLYLDGSSLGFASRQIEFTGKAAHGSEPWNGVNALNAAMLALAAINANRETFREKDRIRIHPIITNGGDLVNVIPDRAVIETYVRGASVGAIEDACGKVDNAVKAGAMAVGATCNVRDTGGYAPLLQSKALSRVFEENALLFIEKENIQRGVDMTGSTDMGDLSRIMPVIQPTMGGFAGALHSKQFAVTDPEAAFITAAKLLACTAYDLLNNHGEKAKQVKDAFEK